MKRLVSGFLMMALGVSPLLAAEDDSVRSTKTLLIFAASSLSESLQQIGPLFQKKYGPKVELNLAATSELRRQLEEGAEADLFASASQDEMDKAVASEVAVDPSVFIRNELVLVVHRNNASRVQKLSDLKKPGVKIVTTSEKVPIGKYTLQVLDKMGADPKFGNDFKDAVRANFVSFELNVKGVVSKVYFQEADAGFVYRSDVTPMMAKELVAYEIPRKLNVKAVYPIAVTKSSKHAEAARKFIEFLKDEEAQAIFQKRNFLPID